MAITRERPTAADVVVTALSPALIMGLVGCLVLFLAEVAYAGRYEGRLLYTLCFFVVGAVGAARVAVVVDRTRAWVYGGLLALVTFIALRVWVEYPDDNPMAPYKDLINVALIAVVWWCSNKLVWDCTFIDDTRTGSGKGLLAAAGWEKRPGIRPDVIEDLQEDEGKYTPGMQGWYQRFDQWRKARAKKPHTPGLTVVYFSLAALPIFGLGQALIPADEEGRRNFAFRLTAGYVGSALGLLMTTSFLGLRRYLRQRKLRMPGTMTATWMGLGGVLIVAFLVVGSLIPRPYSETPIWNPTRGVTPERDASRYAVNRDSGGKGEGRTGEQATKGNGDATGKGGEPGAKGKTGDAKSGSGDKDGKTGGGDGQKDGGNGDQKGNEAKGDPRKEGKESGREAKADPQSGSKGGQNAAERLQHSSTGGTLSKVAGVLKWIVFAALAVVVGFVLFRHGLSVLSNFMPWAKNLLAAIDAWWKGLFGGRDAKPQHGATETSAEAEAGRVPFAAFANPFVDGTAGGRSPEDLVRYSFEGLEAWAGDRDQARRPDETATEFSNRLGDAFPWLRSDARQVANLVGRLMYAGGNLPATARPKLEEFWATLTTGATEPAVVE